MEKIIFLFSGFICAALVVARLVLKRKYIPVDAICTEMHFIRVACGGIFMAKGKGTFSYVVDNIEYIYADSGFVNSSKIQEGSECVLWVDPQDPNNCLAPSYDRTTRILVLLGVLLVVLGVAV